jgi:hypothetical protein
VARLHGIYPMASIRVWHNVIRRCQQSSPNQPPYPAQASDTLTGLGTLFPPKTGSQSPSAAYLKVGLYRKAVNTMPVGPFILYYDEIDRYERRLVILPIPLPWPFSMLKKLVAKINPRHSWPRPPPWRRDEAAGNPLPQFPAGPG